MITVTRCPKHIDCIDYTKEVAELVTASFFRKCHICRYEYKKAHREKNIEKYRKSSRIYAEKNRERNRIYYRINKEKILFQQKLYKKNNLLKKLYNKKRHKYMRETLHDEYIKHLLDAGSTLKWRDITEDMIHVKRLIIQIKRNLNEYHKYERA